MVKTSIDDMHKNQKLTQKCGECSTAVFGDFVKCDECEMILCHKCKHEADDMTFCSGCWRDKE